MTAKLRYFGKCAAIASAVLVGVTGLAAWDDDEPNSRPEFVTKGVGDAVDVNKATQTITPWPKYVRNRKFNLNGERAALAIQRYQQNKSIEPRPTNTTPFAGSGGSGDGVQR